MFGDVIGIGEIKIVKISEASDKIFFRDITTIVKCCIKNIREFEKHINSYRKF